MANTIRLKRGSSAKVAAASLADGEPAFDLTNGKLYIGNGGGKTLVNPDGTGRAFSPSAKVFFQTDGFFDGNANGITGTLKITLPKTWSSTMLSIRIAGYDYSAKGNYGVLVSGYNYSNGTTWINPTVKILGSAPFTSVRLGHDGSRCCILLGTTTTQWQYPKVYVERVIAGYTNTDGWDIGWTLSMITNESGIRNIVAPAVNSGIDADTLDGLQASSFAQLSGGKINASVVPDTIPGKTFSGNVTINGNLTMNSGIYANDFTISGKTIEAGLAMRVAGVNVATVNDIPAVSSGAWTPTIQCGDTYSVREGFYYKVGRQVTLCCKLTFVMKSGYSFSITGLPFAASYSASAIPCELSTAPGFSASSLHLELSGGSSTVNLMSESSGGGTWITDSHDDCANRTATCTINFTMNYITAS